MSLDDLRRRLSRLGVTTGPDAIRPSPHTHGARIEELVNGQVRENAGGACFEVTHTYDPAFVRGAVSLGEWLNQDRSIAATISDLRADGLPELKHMIFLDTETTGLGGAGTLVIMVGLGFFNQVGKFETHQFFMRNPAEEHAMLGLIHDILSQDRGLVTFNGRTFDIPVLSGRFVLARHPTNLSNLPNLDLLLPARRLWRRRLPSCALSALEANILGFRREQRDVPGSLIPYLYNQYLHTGDGREMARVFYHNEQDILSMVTLATILCRSFGHSEGPALPAEDRLSLARWYESRGKLVESETAYRAVIDGASDEQTLHDALLGLGMLLRRLERRTDAVPLWESLADLRLDTLAHEELAKYYEWHAEDLQQALNWAETGIRLAESWPVGLRRIEALHILSHRRDRLLRKMLATSEE